MSQRQKAAVLALLLREVKWFIFDEPTAVLTPEESEAFFELVKRLRSEGRGIILITHKLDEALEASDRVTLIRGGITEEPRNTSELSGESLRNSIFNVETRQSGETSGAATHDYENPILDIKNLCLELPGLPFIRYVNLHLKPGKILGITGVRDSGLETLEKAITGFIRRPGPTGKHGKLEGSITLNGHDITGRGARAFREAGGAYLGADRLGSNLAPDLPLKESLVIHAFRRARRGFGIFLDKRALNSWCGKIMNRAGIDRPVSDRASSFSGGMLQRTLLAREIAENASLLVLAEASSGLDQLNQRKLKEELRAYVSPKRPGPPPSVLLFSTDMAGLLSLVDEVLLLKNGALNER